MRSESYLAYPHPREQRKDGGLMTIIGSVVLAIIVALVAISATCLLKLDGDYYFIKSGPRYKLDNSDVRLRKEVSSPTASEVGRAIVLGVLAGLANYFASSAISVLAVASFVVMIVLYLLISAWWASDEYGGDKWSEMAPFIVLALLFICPTAAAAAGTVAAFGFSGILATVLMRLPLCVFVLAVGFFIANMFFFRYRYPKVGE